MPQKLIILEINEVSLRIFRHYIKKNPNSAIKSLLEQSMVLETVVNDVDIQFLYPSQTWASFNTGAAYNQHKIHWYNDPKTSDFPMYWKTIAETGYSVGLVNTLHSSPADKFIDLGNYKFLVPDCFAENEFASPAYYKSFQALNLKATSLNSRVTTLRLPLAKLILTLMNLPKYGITYKTIFNAVNLLFNILTKKVLKERLRGLQFPIIADIFIHQLRKQIPDLSILFTNHVAANMHRYWYALFPDDYLEKAYDYEWVKKYESEIILSMDVTDNYIHKLMNIAQETDSVLILASSMGQHANQDLSQRIRESGNFDSKLVDVNMLIDKLTNTKFKYLTKEGMWPQYTLEFSSAEEALVCLTEIEKVSPTLENISLLSADINFKTLTLTVTIDNTKDFYYIGDLKFTAKELGFVKFNVEDHHSGCHSPEGSLIIFNSKTAKSNSSNVNYLEYAPAILQHFEIPVADYMIQPSFQI
jgi:hypothetical protein